MGRKEAYVHRIASGVRANGGPVGTPPVRLPEGGFSSIQNARSVFDLKVFGPGARVRQVPLHGNSPTIEQMTILPGLPQPPMYANDRQDSSPRPRVVARPATMGQVPEEDLTLKDARELVDALGTAIDASARALEENVPCVRVDRAALDRARSLRDALALALASGRVEDLMGISPEDIRAAHDVLACERTYRQMSEVNEGRSAAIILAGLAVGMVVLIGVS